MGQCVHVKGKACPKKCGTAGGWQTRAKHTCGFIAGKTFGNYDEAIKKCEGAENCGGVWDGSCEKGKGPAEYYMCIKGRVKLDDGPGNSNQCVHVKASGGDDEDCECEPWQTRAKHTCGFIAGKTWGNYDEAIKKCEGAENCGGVWAGSCEKGKGPAEYYMCIKGSVKLSGKSNECVHVYSDCASETAKPKVTPPKVTKPQDSEKSWAKMEKKECQYYGKVKYTSEDTAKAACLKAGSACGGVLDTKCGGKKSPTSFYLCKPNTLANFDAPS